MTMKITRRATLQSMAGLATAAIATKGFIRSARAQENLKGTGEVIVFDGGGAWGAAQKAAYFDPFEAATGIKVVAAAQIPPGAARASVLAGAPAFDVMDLSGGQVDSFVAEGLLEKIDYSFFRPGDKEAFSPITPTDYMLPSLFYSMVVAYDKEAFSGDAPQTWADLWDVEKFPGKRTIYNAGDDAVSGAVFEIALMADGVAPQSIYPIDFERAFKSLDRLKPNVLRYWTAGAEAAQLLGELIEAEGELPAELDPALLLREVLNEAVGLGPLDELLADDSVSEIMVNRHDEIYLERNGLLQRHPGSFTSARAVLGVIERIVTPLGRRIDEASPMVDARLKDGSRVNAIIPPLALKGPALTIRKFGHRLLEIDRLIEAGSLSPAMAAFMELCVLQRRNVLISGGTGSGKTTLLNILSNFIPNGERIITIEDAAELRLLHPHLISLESRPANAEGRGEVSIRELVKNALRMRPDRIVVGECRGGEALDMLQAMNTGHDGSLTTLHANSARDALARLETLVLMAGMDLPLAAIREQIASAIDIVIQQARLADGRRVVTAIVEVTGTESGHIQIQPLFHHEQIGRDESGRIQSRFSSSGTIPSFCESLRAAGVDIDLSLFDRETSAADRC